MARLWQAILHSRYLPNIENGIRIVKSRQTSFWPIVHALDIISYRWGEIGIFLPYSVLPNYHEGKK